MADAVFLSVEIQTEEGKVSLDVVVSGWDVQVFEVLD